MNPARRLLIGALAAGAALCVGAGAPPAAAATAPAAPGTTTPPLAVTITSIGPAALAPGTTLTVRGTVRNATSRPVPSATITLRERAPLTTRAEVAQWRAGDLDDARVVRLRAQRITQALASGASASFAFTVPASVFGLDPSTTQPEAIGLAVGAEAAATASIPAGERLTVVRTFAVWQPRPVTDPVQLSVLVPITAPVPGKDAGAADAHSRSAWSAQGRLSRVLQATTDTRLSWAVDPALLSSATAASTATHSTSTSAAQPAGGWLQAFRAGARNRDVSVLPWADPDVLALARSGGIGLLTEAETAASTELSQVLDRRPTAVVTLPADVRADTASVQTLARSGRTIVLDSALVRGTPAVPGGRAELALATRRQTSVAQTLISDHALNDELAAGGEGAVPTQDLLADLAVASAENPGQSLLATTPRSWNPDPATARRTFAALEAAGWVSLSPYSTLSQATASGGPRSVTLGYSNAEVRRGLPSDHVAAVVAADRGLSGFAPALVDPLPVTQWRVQALSLVSLGWRGHTDTALALARTSLTTAVNGLYSGLSVDPGSTKNLLAKEGLLPITVHNGLPFRIHALLVLTPLTGQLSVKGAVDLVLPANSPLQVSVPIRAVANGDVDVVATFLTRDEHTVLSPSPTRIHVRVRSEWETRGLGIIAILLGLLLLVGLARSMRRGRVRTRIPPESVPDPDDIGRVRVREATRDQVRESGSESTGRHADVSGDGQRSGEAPVGAGRGRGRHAERVAPDPVAVEPAARAVATVVAAPAAVAAAAGNGRMSATVTLPDRDVRPSSPATLPASGAGPAPDPAAGPRPEAMPLTVDDADAPKAPADGGFPADDGSGAEPPGEGPGDGVSADDGSGGTARLLGSSAVMAAGTLLSRLLGMVRVVIQAWVIGAAFSANAFNTANTLPNSLFLLIGGGVLNAVLVPQIVAAMRRPDGGREYVDRLLTLSLGVLTVATVAVTAMAPLFLRLFGASSWTPTQVAVGVAFAFWCLPQVFFYGLYTVLGQVLNARGSFGPYMWAPVVNNVVAIAGMLVFVALYGSGDHPAQWWTAGAIAVLGGTTTLGVIAQAVILIPVLRRNGFRWRPRRGFRGVGLRTAGSVAGWTFGALLVGQLGLVLVSRVANQAGQQAGDAGTGRFVYDVAYLLFMLPHSLVAVSVVTAVFTRMSHAVVTDRLDAVRADVSVALRTIGVATVLATAAFAVLGQDITTLLFATNPYATAQGLAWTTTAMVIGLVPFSAMYLFQRVFYAFGDARTPFWAQLVVIVVWSVGNVVAGARLRGVAAVVGIGVAMSVANVVGALVLGVLTRRRIGGVDGMRVLSTYLRCVIAGVAAAVLGWAADAATHLVVGDGHRGTLLALVIGSVVLLAVYVGGLRLLRVRELADLAAPLRRFVHI